MKIITDIIYIFIAFIIRLILRMNGGFEVIGKENVPTEGGVLIAANHISYLDPPVVGSLVPRRATFMARKGLFDIPVLSWMIKHAAFPVDREKTRPSTIKETVKRLKNGELVVIFPEGKRSDSGKLMEAKRGIGMVVRLSKVPVVPTLILGTDEALKVDAKWLSRARVTVVFGKPLYNTEGIEAEESHVQATHEEISMNIMKQIGEMQQHYGN